MPEYFRVKEAFAYGNAVASPGQIWSSDNPDIKGREHLFESVEVAAARSATETASAAPGETRARSKRLGRKSDHTPEPPAEPEAPATPAEEEN